MGVKYFISRDDVTFPCVEVHEGSHVLDIEACCAELGKAYVPGGGVATLRLAWHAWIAENLRYVECRAYQLQNHCLYRLKREHDCILHYKTPKCKAINKMICEVEDWLKHFNCSKPLPKSLTPCPFEEGAISF